MFRGDHPELDRMIGRALARARQLGHPRTGSEHLLLALTTSSIGPVLAEHGATEAAVEAAVRQAAPKGAGAAADRKALAAIGVDFDKLPVDLDRPPAREPFFPLGAKKTRRRCAKLRLGLDAQAAYEASLRLALARRERDHRPEHLALALVSLDPGIAWVLATANVDVPALRAGLKRNFPPPHRNPLLRAERRLGRNHRLRDLTKRYERTTGRTAAGLL